MTKKVFEWFGLDCHLNIIITGVQEISNVGILDLDRK